MLNQEKTREQLSERVEELQEIETENAKKAVELIEGKGI